MNDPIRLVRPCDRRWSELRGDDRRRWCDDCGKFVHNLDALPASEVAALRRGGGVCATWVPKARGEPFVPRLPASIAATVALSLFGGCGVGPAPDSASEPAATPAPTPEGSVPCPKDEPVRQREATPEMTEQLRQLGYVGD